MEQNYYLARKDQAPFIVTGRVYRAEFVSQTMVKLWDTRTNNSMTIERIKLADKSLFEKVDGNGNILA